MSDIVVSNELGNNLLENLLQLYITLRSHSHAKKLKEAHKIQNKKYKSKSLRKSIKKAMSENE